MKVAYLRAYGLARPGAIRALAAFIDEERPDILAVAEIDAGDALAVAVRFAREWAFRAGHALFWHRPYVAHGAHDVALPLLPTRPFQRRGLLHVNGSIDKARVDLLATQLSRERILRIPEIRFARSQQKRLVHPSIFFCCCDCERGTFAVNGFAEVARDERDALHVYARDFAIEHARTLPPTPSLGSAIVLDATYFQTVLA